MSEDMHSRCRSRAFLSDRALPVCCCFAEEGAKVVIADLTLRAAQATAEEFAAAGHAALAVAMHVTDEAAVKTGIAAAAKAYYKIDILVSNAGIQIVNPLDEFPSPNGRLAIYVDDAFPTTKAC
jgi:3-hydroxybutyrate dehydrogenase